MFVLGVDPGLSRCGYGVVGLRGRRPRALSVGVIRTDPGHPVPVRLAELAAEIRRLLADASPDVVAVERVFFSVNARTAMATAQAAGIVMAEAVGAGAEVVEYTPNQVKEAVTGDGAAGKDQVERMIRTLLGITDPVRPADAADAVAVALCHLAHAPLRRRAAAVGGRR